MKKLVIVLILIALAAVGVYWTASHYVVKSEWGLMVLEKRFLTFRDSFVNAKEWDYPEYREHPDIMAAMGEQGYSDVLDRMERKHAERLDEKEDQRRKEKLEDLKQQMQSDMESWKQSVMDLIPEEWRNVIPQQQPATKADGDEQEN